MNFIGENEYNALIDMLKNITDVVSELTIKINSQEEEINKLKENILKNNIINKSQIEQVKEEPISIEYTQDITTIRDTEIENIKKKKLLQVVDNIIQQKKTIENIDNNEIPQIIQKPPMRKKTIFSRKF